MANVSVSIVGAIKEVASAIKTYYQTRHEVYHIKMDKKLRKGLDYGEKYILMNESDDDKKETYLKKYRTRFFKYN